ncbi:MAG TPA: hypothetical protein VFE58_19865 [Tepidisphaeraceae bacterium]|jgi:hypothetical protein|nr:hypothetical protein [Tepidisphaeraceae bacterium]
MSEPTHSYYDWQVSTLMLAYDVATPLHRDDLKQLQERQQSVELELRDMVHNVLPKSYLENPHSDFPPEVVTLLTKATLARATEIIASSPSPRL